jgi:endonuclease/exonuclease/phosphatase family metal-dependent hydrolase
MNLKLVSYNLHKGKNILGQDIVFDYLKDFIKTHEFDIGLFQEVLGNHQYNENIPHQIEKLADKKWHEYSFAKNSVVTDFDHGNSILSKFPILEEKVCDLTLNRFEKRCAVLTIIDLGTTKLACICTHLNLRQNDRLKQARMIIEFINKNVTNDIPIILGGDLNDWTGKVTKLLRDEGGFHTNTLTPPLKTFPSFFPLLPLDRLLFKNLVITKQLRGDPKEFRKLSDHLPIYCNIEVKV